MSFWSNLRKVAEPAVGIASAVVPGKAGDIARIVEKAISNETDPNNLGALRQLASEILELKLRVSHLEDVVTFRHK